MKVNRKQLTLVGTALYGDNWKTSLADVIGVSERTMRRYSKTGVTLSGAQVSRIRHAAKAHITELDHLVYFLSNGEIVDD